jgi:hypothetical protein
MTFTINSGISLNTQSKEEAPMKVEINVPEAVGLFKGIRCQPEKHVGMI